MKTLVLTGMSGSGKTTVGKYLARETNYFFIDIDSLIEQSLGMKITEIFSEKGEKFFRELEAKNIQEIFNSENLIISLGGGAFENEKTRNLLLNNAYVIYLKTSSENILKRLQNTNDRPLLNNSMNIEKIENILKIRSKNYELAHFTILTDNKSIERVVGEISECVNLK